MSKKKYTSKRKRLTKKVNLFESYTKVAVTVLLIFALIDLQLSYILAFLGRDQIAENLSVTIVTEIIGVMLGYFLKAFFESYHEHRNQLYRELGIPISNTDKFKFHKDDEKNDECECEEDFSEEDSDEEECEEDE